MINYKELSSLYNTYHSVPEKYFNLQIEKIKNLLEMSFDSIIVDAGCGTGRLLLPLSNYCKKIIGIEKSKDMFDVTNSKLERKNIDIRNITFSEYLDFGLKSDGIYFSMSLHQMGNKIEQINIIKDSLKLTKNVLLITVVNKQFNEILLNCFFPTLNIIDRNRFLDIDELNRIFDIEYFESCTIKQRYSKILYLQMLKDKYISSLQLIDDNELKIGIDKIDSNFDNIIEVNDCYSYILIKNEK